jgi:hypothetical protein
MLFRAKDDGGARAMEGVPMSPRDVLAGNLLEQPSPERGPSCASRIRSESGGGRSIHG